MKIFIYSLKREISQIISDHLSDKGHLCISFNSQTDISFAIRNQKKLPDLMLLDYLLFNHDIFNLYNYLEEVDLSFPVIFYNDPCLIRSSRAAHWKAILELTQSKYIAQDFSLYEPVFKELQELIESEEFKPYIPLMQSEKALPLSLIKDSYTLQYLKENKNDCIYEFKKRSKIPDNLFYLLELLQKNKEIELSLNDIVQLYEKDEKSISIDSLKVLLSRLRNYIRQDNKCPFLIYHDTNRYRFIRFRI